MKQTVSHLPTGTPIEIWLQDEARIGQKNKRVRQWAEKGSRPCQPSDQRYKSVYIFGAVCPGRDIGVAWVEPRCNTAAMQVQIDEIGKAVCPGAHGVVLCDGAAWHKTPKLNIPDNISLIIIPPYCPELNPAENIWQFLRQNYLSAQVYETVEEIVEACCYAWNSLIAETGRIASIASRDWF